VLSPLVERDNLPADGLKEVWITLAVVNHNRANLLNVTPRFRESDAMYREAIRLYEQVTQSNPEYRKALASALGDWARYLHYLEDFEKAEAPRDRASFAHAAGEITLRPTYRYHGHSLPELGSPDAAV
jgi:tetratricopeptide (TPR) repeat protein